MLNIKNLSGGFKYQYKVLLDRRKDNPDALCFLKLLDETENCLFLTGKAGTGKSTLIRDVVDFCTTIGRPPLVLWSTWISAINIWWQTAHSFFWLWIDNVHPKEIRPHLFDKASRRYKLRKSKLQTLVNVPFVIIDEVGMLNANTLDCINFLMKYYLAHETGDKNLINKPFWGKPIIFVWDVFQLSPVTKPEWIEKFAENYESGRFFDSTTFKKKELPYNIINLKKNYRQESDTFFWEILDAIRDETISDEHISILNKQVGEADPDVVLLSTHIYRVDDINHKKIAQLPWKEYVYEGQTEWIFPETMKKADNILRVKEWAKVMLVANDVSWRRVNWSMWMVKNISEDCINIQIWTEVFPISQEVQENKETIVSSKWAITENILWTYTQFPLKLAYAITIHKSQWMTFDACNLDLSDTFTWWQAYTALSRSRTLSGIKLLSRIEKKNLFFDPPIKNFVQEVMPWKIVQGIDVSDYLKYFSQYTKDNTSYATKDISYTKGNAVNYERNKIQSEPVEDDELFQILRDLRSSIAQDTWMPAYIVFPNSVLQDLVKHKPRNKQEMLRIKWIKQMKFDKYGEQFLTKIMESTKPNNIGSNQDIPDIQNKTIMEKDIAMNQWKSRKKDEDRLFSLFQKWLSPEELGSIFSRTPSAVFEKLKKILNQKDDNVKLYWFYDEVKLYWFNEKTTWKIIDKSIDELIKWEDIWVVKMAWYVNKKNGTDITWQDINNWLKSKWILSECMQENWKTRTITNDESKKYGLITKKKMNINGNKEYDAILFTEWWKTFILDHIKNIEEYKNKNTLGK